MLTPVVYRALRILTLMIPRVSRSATILYDDYSGHGTLIGHYSSDGKEYEGVMDQATLPEVSERMPENSGTLLYIGKLRPSDWDLSDIVRILRTGYIYTDAPSTLMLYSLLSDMPRLWFLGDTDTEEGRIAGHKQDRIMAKLLNTTEEAVVDMHASTMALSTARVLRPIRGDGSSMCCTTYGGLDSQRYTLPVLRMFLSLADDPMTVVLKAMNNHIFFKILRLQGESESGCDFDSLLCKAPVYMEFDNAFTASMWDVVRTDATTPWAFCSGKLSFYSAFSPLSITELNDNPVPDFSAPDILYMDDENRQKYSVAYFLRMAKAHGLPVDDIWNPLIDKSLSL